MKLTLIFVLPFFIAMTSCYRMPGEDEFSVVPTTNNPSVTCEKGGSFLNGLCNQ